MPSQASKATCFSLIHLLAAGAVYYHLYTGGWLNTNYHLNDPNIVNLVLAIFEPIAVVSVIAYWAGRKPWLFRTLRNLCLVQIVVGLGFLVFILIFMLTWHPKFM